MAKQFTTHQVVGGNAVLAKGVPLSEALSVLEHKIGPFMTDPESKWVNISFSREGDVTEAYTISLTNK